MVSLFIHIYKLIKIFQISCINPLKVPDRQKYFKIHHWFLYYIMFIKFDTCFAHVYGFTTFKTKVTYKNTDYSRHKSRQWPKMQFTRQSLQATLTVYASFVWKQKVVYHSEFWWKVLKHRKTHLQFSFMFVR